MSISQKIIELIQTVRTSTGRKPISVLGETDPMAGTAGLDSLDLAELAVRIEAEFGVDVFDRGIPETVGNIVRRLEG